MAKKTGTHRSDSQPMIFDPWNYKVLFAGLLAVTLGFVAMYLENEVKGVVSLYISPILIMAGYISVIFAIMQHDKERDG